MKEILESDTSDTEKAIVMLLYLMRAQLFLDSNKRIATFACNKVLVSTGHGIFSLPPELKEEFAEKLIRYYETDKINELKEFVYDNCLSGL